MKPTFFDTDFKARKQFVFEDMQRNISVSMLREDEIHPQVSGNKFRKLKYNLKEAKSLGYKQVLSFGGAYSNHVAALAAACDQLDMNCVGVIRGDELANFTEDKLRANPTLNFALDYNMQLKFVSREAYRSKEKPEFLADLRKEFGDFFLVPEGGTNELAVKGCQEILNDETQEFDVICVSVGTGGTMAGLVEASQKHQHVIGFAALNSDYLTHEVSRMTSKDNWKINYDFHFGGYAKVNDTLVDFINVFSKNFGIHLDPIYTGKMMFGISELIKCDFFPKNTRILAVHTGGLQGIEGFNSTRVKKGSSIIQKVI